MDFGLFFYCQGRGVPDDQAYVEMIGIDTLLLVASFGNLTHEQVCSSLDLFAKAVM